MAHWIKGNVKNLRNKSPIKHKTPFGITGSDLLRGAFS